MKRGDWIQHIITTHMPVYAGLAPSLDMMHAALSAFGKCDRFDLVLEWLEKMEKEEIVQPSLYENEPKEMVERERHDIRFGTPLQNFTVPAPDRLAYQTASSAFSNVRRGSEAASILRRMQVIGGFKPDLRSCKYHVYESML
jgi:pentatricopeptide repeat protein